MARAASLYYHWHGMEEIRFCYRCASPVAPQFLYGRIRPVCTACGAVVFLNPKVVAGVLTEMDGQVVMVRRRTEPGAGKWGIPAGYVDLGETVEEAAVRELNEETGLEAAVTGLVGLYSRPEDSNILVVYAGKVVGGKLTPGPETQEVGLFSVESLPALAFERDYGIIQQWQNSRDRSSEPG